MATSGGQCHRNCSYGMCCIHYHIVLQKLQEAATSQHQENPVCPRKSNFRKWKFEWSRPVPGRPTPIAQTAPAIAQRPATAPGPNSHPTGHQRSVATATNQKGPISRRRRIVCPVDRDRCILQLNQQGLLRVATSSLARQAATLAYEMLRIPRIKLRFNSRHS